MKLFKTKADIVFLAAIILMGCDFSSSNKKTEIKFSENQTTNEAGEKSASELGQEAPKEIANKADNGGFEEGNSSKITEEINSEVEKKETVLETTPVFKIADKLVGWGYAKSKERKIDTIIIHSSYNSLGGDEHSLEKVLDIYESYGVAPHFIISREGKIYRLVKEENIAYHAGVSEVPDGRENVNEFSLGIELINTKTESPSSAQYSSLKKLLDYIKEKYKNKYVLGHSDIAPDRKDDPWNFDWGKIK